MSEFIPEVDKSEMGIDKKSKVLDNLKLPNDEPSAYDKFRAQKAMMDKAMDKLRGLPGVMGYEDGSTSINDLLEGEEDPLSYTIDAIVENHFSDHKPVPLSTLMNEIMNNITIGNIMDKTDLIYLREALMEIFIYTFRNRNIIPIPKVEFEDNQSIILSDILFYKNGDL